MAAGAWGVARTMGRDSSVVDESVPRGTTRRVLSYARPYRGTIAVFLVIVTLAALTSVACLLYTSPSPRD